ncbi:MAG: NAD(P)/FAD-dependent oxidoreductase [Planctomycetota bacterium]
MATDQMQHHDVIVIGAGVAGASVALRLARIGVDVLLVDRATFPRRTVCGCCLNPRSLAQLESLGVLDVIRAAGARPTRHLEVRGFGRHITRSIPAGLSFSRSQLDLLLVNAGRRAGVTFHDGTSATVETEFSDDRRVVRIGSARHSASMVIIADGLGGSSLREIPEMAPTIRRGAVIGVATTVPDHADLPVDTISMCTTTHGYVGFARIEGHRIDCAAAIDPTWLRAVGGPAAAVAHIIDETNGPSLDLEQADWFGTGRLTRHRTRCAAHRLCVIGDAAGYVEPFTGEGMAWAFEAGALVAPIAAAARDDWSQRQEHAWQRAYDRHIRRRQRWCRLLARTVRHPRRMRAAMTLLHHAPWLAAPVMRSTATSRWMRAEVAT